MHPPPATLQALRARLQSGPPVAVAQACVRLAAQFPQSWQPWALLAQALQRLGQAAESTTAWAQARARARDRDDRLGLAQEALHAGQVDLGDALLTAVCNEEPESMMLWVSLSRLRRERGLAAAALPVARALVRRFPEEVEVWLELARVQAAAADVRACRDACRRALELLEHAPLDAPARHEARLAASQLLLASGHAAEAGAAAEKLPQTIAQRAPMLGMVAEREGRRAEALALLDPWIRAGEASAHELSVWARLLRRSPRSEEALKKLQAALQRTTELPTRRMLLHRMGELYEGREDWDHAFQAHAAANQCGLLPWPVERFERDLAAVHELARQPLPARPAGGELPGAGIVLIAGLPRSGTSLLEQILTMHPEIRGIGESSELRRALQALPGPADSPWPERLAAAGPADRAQVAERYLAAVREDAGDVGIRLDKTPPNLPLVDGLARILPGARAILLRRDPRDACVSCFFQSFGPFYAWTDHLPWLGRVARAYDGLRQRFLDHPPMPTLGVDYEALVRTPKAELRRVLDFLGLPWHPALLRFHESTREMRTASYAQVRSPIHTRSIGRAHHYTRWLGPLDAALAGEPEAP